MGPTSKIAFLPSSDDQKRLTELASYRNDLTEAASALDAALEADTASKLWHPLTSHAATAYLRCFIESKVRPCLDASSYVPPDMANLHETIRMFRNRTVAHSQSELAMPVVVALRGEDGRPREVLAATISHAIPHLVAEQFLRLVETICHMVEVQMVSVTRLLRDWAITVPASTVDTWPTPTIVDRCDVDFTAASSRSPGEPRFTLYWRPELGSVPLGSMPECSG